MVTHSATVLGLHPKGIEIPTPDRNSHDGLFLPLDFAVTIASHPKVSTNAKGVAPEFNRCVMVFGPQLFGGCEDMAIAFDAWCAACQIGEMSVAIIMKPLILFKCAFKAQYLTRYTQALRYLTAHQARRRQARLSGGPSSEAHGALKTIMGLSRAQMDILIKTTSGSRWPLRFQTAARQFQN